MPDNHDAAIPPTVDNSLAIGYIPSDVLLLIFYSLHGQDIVRCIRVCRSFAALIHSDLYLRYKIELEQNGMVEGDSSALSTSERLRRLRQYSSNFRNGVFDRGEDHTELPDHMLEVGVISRKTSYHDSSSPVFHVEFDQPAGRFLHAFTHGSTQAGIQPRNWLMPLGSHLGRKWAVDDAQDLLVMAEVAMPPLGEWEWFIEVKFLSLDGSKTTVTAHPAASQPSIRARPVRTSELVGETVVQLAIFGQHVIWEFSDPQRDEAAHYLVEVCNWKTGQVISRIDVGTSPVHVIPLDHPYLLVLPNVKPYPELSIYTFAPSAPSSSSLVCTLQLPELHPAQHISWHDICTSRRPPARSGHFRADPAHWMIAFALYTALGRHRFTSHLLIPRATLSAQVRAAEARQRQLERARGEGGLEGESSVPVLVPWQDWGPRGCLRLRLLRAPFSGILRLVPFGSWMPFVVFDPPTTQSASVYVFDLNPLAARRARQSLSPSSPSRGDGSPDGGLAGAGAGAIVEDVEGALPGVVDPGCSAIPYVVYRFNVPERLEIRSVVVSMTGFMVLSDDPEAEKAVQTWTV